MRLAQGAFAYLPPLTEGQVRAQVRYMVARGWAVAVEFSDDPHPRNVYWAMWKLPMFDLTDPDPVMRQIAACREAHPLAYIQVNGYDPSPMRQGQALSVLVHRPPDAGKEHRLSRTEVQGQIIRYTLHSPADGPPAGNRCSPGGDGAGSPVVRRDEPEESGGWAD